MMKLNSWTLIGLNILIAFLILSFVVLSLQTAHDSERSITQIDQLQFPILEELAIVSQLNQTVEQKFFLASMGARSSKSEIQDYELAVDALSQRLQELNRMLKQVPELPPSLQLGRETLFEIEAQILLDPSRGSDLARLNASRLKPAQQEFKKDVFRVSQALAHFRSEYLDRRQRDFSRSFRIQVALLLLTGILMVLSLVIYFRQVRRSQDLEARALHSAKLAALGEMAGGIAHEINNPLAVISGNLELIQKSLSQPNRDFEKLSDRVEKTKVIVKRISMIVRSLKDFSRDGSKDSFQSFLVETLIDEVLMICAERIKVFNVRFEHVGEKGLMIHGNKTELSQVLVNLLNNSIDAISPLSEKWILLRSFVDSKTGGVCLSLKDSGSGLPSHLRSEIFKPFYTTKPIGEGTGLGLSISHSIMRRHGGDLRLEPGSANTEFILEFPALLSHQDQQRSAS